MRMSGTPTLTLTLTVLAVFICFWSGSFPADAESRLPQAENNVTSSAKDKFFSIFTIVKFDAASCTTTDNLNGTCYASAVCAEKGGTSKGTCASGFGVCCFFTVSTCGSTVTQNCTFIRNPGYPSTYSTAGTCTYFISKCNCDICQIRLDFEAFTIADPTNAGATAGVCATDMFTMTTPTGQTLPTLCGINAGHHVYIDAGNVCSDTVSLSYILSGTTVARTWSVKVSQIPCNTNYKADEGCIQQYYGVSGQVRSFNFLNPSPQYLTPLDVQICVRMEAGYCGISWSVSPDPNAFQTSTVAGNRGAAAAMCNPANPQVYIPNSNSVNAVGPTFDVYCGMSLTDQVGGTNRPIISYTKPFTIRHLARTVATVNIAQRGFCLNYRQLPCPGAG